MAKAPRLLEQVQHQIRLRHFSIRTERSYLNRTIQDLLGHKDVSTTMIYTHIIRQGGMAVHSPVDKMFEGFNEN